MPGLKAATLPRKFPDTMIACGARVGRCIRNVRTLVFAILSLTGVLCCFAQTTPNPIETVQAALRARDYDRALYIAQSALNKRPNDFRILTLEGVILALKGNPEAALAAFNKALTIAPHYLEAMRGAAQLEYQLGDPRAKNLLKQTVIAAPHDETAHAMLGVIAQQENDCGTATNEFQDAGSVIWSDHQALEIYGYCLEQLKRPRQAVPIFARLLWLAPHNNDVRYDLAVVQLQAGDAKGTIDTLAPVLAGDIADTDVLSLASDAYEAAGDTPRAVALLRQAIVLKPTTSNNYLAFAALSFDHSSFQVGVDMLDAGLQRLPQDSSLYLARGMLYVQIDDFAKAQADFTRAERLNPGQSLGQYAQGLLELSKHDPDEALKVVRTELEKRPDDALLHYLLARVLHERGAEPGTKEFQEALGAALRAVQLDPSLVYARDLLSSMYLDAGQNDLAIEQSRAAIRLSPNDRIALYHLIIALRKSGRAGEIPALTQRLSSVIQEATKLELDRKRFRLFDRSGVSPQ